MQAVTISTQNYLLSNRNQKVSGAFLPLSRCHNNTVCIQLIQKISRMKLRWNKRWKKLFCKEVRQEKVQQENIKIIVEKKRGKIFESNFASFQALRWRNFNLGQRIHNKEDILVSRVKIKNCLKIETCSKVNEKVKTIKKHSSNNYVLLPSIKITYLRKETFKIFKTLKIKLQFIKHLTKQRQLLDLNSWRFVQSF